MEYSTQHQLAFQCLRSLSIGDAFGESFFGETELMLEHIRQRTIPDTSWEFTDDTIMSIAIYQQLVQHDGIQQDELAALFVKNHDIDPMRGYGAGARKMLREISEGQNWKDLAENAFEGMGSKGNGSAMRAGPIGAYFHDDLARVKRECILSATVTHTHQEAVNGAIAVGIATALATKYSLGKQNIQPSSFIEEIMSHLEHCTVRSRLHRSVSMHRDTHTDTLRKLLGNGSQIMAEDTVPFAIWCAAHYLDDFEKAMWKSVSVLGDRDTIAAIVGSIVGMFSYASIPSKWMDSVEKFEKSTFIS